MITVVGLGVEKGDLTKSGERAIRCASCVLVRTANTRSYQSVQELGVKHECLDGVYQKSRSFSTLNKNLAARVLAAEKEFGDVAYVVDGAACEDNSVKILCKRAKGRVATLGGVSKASAFAARAGFVGCSYFALSAYELEECVLRQGLPTPLIVYDLDDKAFAGDVKLLLMSYLGEDCPALFMTENGDKKLPVYELDRQENAAYGYATAVAVDVVPFEKKTRFDLHDLHAVIKRLRRPDGCPWDRVQTTQSIKMNAVEEAYELLDAIELDDDEKILEETGDLLMQVVFHAVLKEEQGAFELGDVIKGVCDKLITRHTHIFGGDKAGNADEALSVWDKNKMKEKGQETYAAAVNDVPNCFPALLQAQKIAKRLEKGGWGYADFGAALAALEESEKQLCSAVENGDEEKIKLALGQMLMQAAWVARKTGADGETVLLEQIGKEKRFFEAYEKAVLAAGKDVTALSQDEKAQFAARVKEEQGV